MAAEKGKNSEIGYACGETILSILAYADDMVMLASSEEGLAEMVRALERFSRWTGLEISTVRSSTLCNDVLKAL